MGRLFYFNKSQEKHYKHRTYLSDLSNIRIMLLLCVFFYSGFGLLDLFVQVPYIDLFLFIRFVLVNPFFIIGIALSFHPKFEKIHQAILLLAYLAAGFGIVTMLVLLPDNFSYYGGLFLIFAVGHFLTRLYWHYMTIGSLTILSTYAMAAYVVGNQPRTLLIYVFFYSGFVFICVYASYIAERFRRSQFLHTLDLEGDKVTLEKEIYTKLLDVENANRITIYALARLSESKDDFTGDHIERVGLLCLQVSKHLEDQTFEDNHIDKESFISVIELASTLHDIGKVAIPEAILMKPGRLTEDEMAVMKLHTIYGYETLMKIRHKYQKNDFINMGIDICKHHHERWDGRGYPVGLAGEEIPLSARIVSVVDVYDALVSERPYKKAYSHAYALEEIQKGAGSMFDPQIVQAFVRLKNNEEGESYV